MFLKFKTPLPFDEKSLATRLAISRGAILFEPDATTADPPDPPPWNAHDERMIWNIARHHGAGCHECVPPNSCSAHHSRISPESCPSLNQSFLIFIPPIDVAAWVNDVCEDHRRPAEHIVFKLDSGIYRYIVLHLDVFSESHTWTD